MNRVRGAWAAAIALAGIVAAGSAETRAESYPSQTIKMVVGFGPGSTADVVTRLVAKHLETALGKAVVVENRLGNGSMLAAEQVARAPKDGHTLFMATIAQALVPIRKRMDFKLDRDMAPIALLTVVPSLFAAHPSLKVQNIKELQAVIAAKPDSLTFGTSGAGTASHLAAELFNQSVGAKIVMVHYQGGSNQMLVDLLAGRINLAFNVAATMAPHAERGDIVALGMAQPARAKLMPTVPTLSEQGFPAFDARVWIGLLAPNGTPAEIIDLLAKHASESLKSEAVLKVLDAQGMEPLGGTPAEFGKFIGGEIDKWSKVVSSAGLYE